MAKSNYVARARARAHTHTHTHTHMFNGPFSGTTQVSRYQKGKTNLDFTEARDNGISCALCKSAQFKTDSYLQDLLLWLGP